MTGKSNRLRAEDQRVALRLVSDLRDLRRDPAALRAHLVEQLARLVGATGGFATDVVGWMPRDPSAPDRARICTLTPTQKGFEIVGAVMASLAKVGTLWDDPTFARAVQFTGTAESRAFHTFVDDAVLRDEFPHFMEIKRQSRHVDHLVCWYQKDVDARTGRPAGHVLGVSLHRYDACEDLFNPRETALAGLVMDELRALHHAGLLDAQPDAFAVLSNRQRQVLQLIRLGHAPKQIAHRLNLSIHTVRDHIRHIHELTGASGRGELLAIFAGLLEPPRPQVDLHARGRAHGRPTRSDER